jgi:hypothetical protein
MAVNGAAFLREPRHINRAASLPLDMGSHPEKRADRHDAGTADAGNEDREGLLAKRWQNGIRQRRKIIADFRFSRNRRSLRKRVY